ncbi:YebC/PmpR family DNA-binding transcriptional regulator [Armatimonas rosea]|uniref:Probable transcriptional regulatory protein HNQ39_000976 n=1 Tax=Armatimonas rosea TaxID=685828 RepID=A0A7W9SNN2_ARMRO|nr:YebC/PmpR family DNA-binding transcriptional regulator [Armatimonas rosea]MBB6049214.1 YebC/PmpR family DNA-binding regulatory protein [Armatimonas rosea]
MSGHSKWHNIRLRKGKQDAVRGKLFTKLAKEIIIAAKGGGNPDTNIRLRMAVQTAKQNSVPADTIKRAIQRGTGELDGGNLDERTFEGYGPGGVAIIVESLTDNINRTYPELRSAFAKNGGRIGDSGSVAYLFERKGILVIDPGVTTEEVLMEVAIEAGAEDVQPSEDGGFEVTTAFEDFATVRDALDAAKIATSSADIQQIPTTRAELDVAEQKKVLKLLDALEDNDDVQNVYHNLELSEEALED